MAKKLSIAQLLAIGALAALYTILSAPGAIVAALTGISFFSAVANILIIGIMYPLVPLLFKRVGAVPLGFNCWNHIYTSTLGGTARIFTKSGLYGVLGLIC